MRTTLYHHDCPRCGTTLDDGPVLFRCAHCHTSIYAADLNTEFRRSTKTTPRHARTA